MNDKINIPSPILILNKLREVEEDLLTTESPVEASPLLSKRYELMYLLVINDLWGNIRNKEASQLIEADAQAKQIKEYLFDAVQKSSNGVRDAVGQMGIARGGILSRIGKPH